MRDFMIYTSQLGNPLPLSSFFLPEKMIFENLLCLILVLFFIGFVIELVRGKFKIGLPKRDQTGLDLYRPYLHRRSGPYRFMRFTTYNNSGQYGSQSNRRNRRNRRRQNRRQNAGNAHFASVFDSGLPSYQDSQNITDSRDLN